MNKAMTLFLAIICSIVTALPFSLPMAQAEEEESISATEGMRKKRYRYRKRALRVQVGADVTPWSEVSNKGGIPFNVDLLVGYNLGYFEMGANANFDKTAASSDKIEIEAGVWGEFNFIKNTRKQKVVPALGLKVNYRKPDTGTDELLLAPYFSLKYFPASRTGLVLTADLDILSKLANLFQNNTEMGIDVSLAYVHYFHL